MGYKTKGLYIFSEKGQGKVYFQVRTNLAFVSSKIWHRRLGHKSNKKLNILHVIDKSISKGNKTIYQTCPLAKQTKLPFCKSIRKTTKPFELIHLPTMDKIIF